MDTPHPEAPLGASAELRAAVAASQAEVEPAADKDGPFHLPAAADQAAGPTEPHLETSAQQEDAGPGADKAAEDADGAGAGEGAPHAATLATGAAEAEPETAASGLGSGGRADILQMEHSLHAAGMLDLDAENSDLLEGAPAAEEEVVETIKALKLGEHMAAKGTSPAMPALPAVGSMIGAGATPRMSAHAGQGRRPHKLSFSAPPHVPRPKMAVRHNYSHSPVRVRQILADNEMLVRRLGDITYSRSRIERDMVKHDKLMSNVAASSAKRRQLEAGKIVNQNLELYKRLQAVKPSKAVSRKEHRASFIKSREYVVNVSTMKNGSRRQSVAASVPPAPCTADAAQD